LAGSHRRELLLLYNNQRDEEHSLSLIFATNFGLELILTHLAWPTSAGGEA
jgi:hypothetical protein